MTSDLTATPAPAPDAPSARSRDARQLRSDGALRAALLELITRHPFDKLTVRDIVAEAGIGYATFFRHYPSKEALLDAVAGEEIENLLRLSSPLLRPEDTLTSCLALAHHVDDRRAVWTALLTGGAGAVLREQFARLAVGSAGPREFNSDWLPAELGLIVGVTVTVEILAWWLGKAPHYTPDQVARLLDRLAVGPAVGSANQR